MNANALPDAFNAYADTFPAEEMYLLKREHTRRVAGLAARILDDGEFPKGKSLRETGMAAAWLHDLGRFKQFRQYRTFSDRQSVNHALLSCGEALRLGWLDDWEPVARNRALQAIAFHNLRELPPGLSAEDAALAHLVRDADKLDIFAVLDQAIATNYLPSRPEVYWGLPFAAPPNPVLVAAFERGESPNYADLQSFADFVFVQLAWCKGGIRFAESRRIALERHEVDIRQDYLCAILPEHAALFRRCCAQAREALERGGHGS